MEIGKEVQQLNARMENEPQEIYLVCFDLSETNKDYLPEHNDFDSLEGENVLWSPNDIAGMATIKYVHHSRISEFEAELNKYREALEESSLQIEYLHGKFKQTGSGNAVLARIKQVLNTEKG